MSSWPMAAAMRLSFALVLMRSARKLSSMSKCAILNTDTVSSNAIFLFLSVDTRSGKQIYRKHTVVNVAFTESIPDIVFSMGNVKYSN
jgi:hypothetical protein